MAFQFLKTVFSVRYKLMFCIQFGRNSVFKVLQHITAQHLPCPHMNHSKCCSTLQHSTSPALTWTIFSPILVIFTANCGRCSAQTALCLITYCNVTPCSPVNVYWLLEGTCFLCLLPWRWGQTFYPKRRYEYAAVQGVSFWKTLLVVFTMRHEQDYVAFVCKCVKLFVFRLCRIAQ
jgi:hypothetical protein